MIYSYQGNRNPFIDHLEYVGLIWGGVTPVGSTPDEDKEDFVKSITWFQEGTNLKINIPYFVPLFRSFFKDL